MVLFSAPKAPSVVIFTDVIPAGGFKNLLLIEPKPTFPNDKITATSVGARDLIEKAKVYPNLETFVYKGALESCWQNMKNFYLHEQFFYFFIHFFSLTICTEIYKNEAH